jgi:hypothetical protein
MVSWRNKIAIKGVEKFAFVKSSVKFSTCKNNARVIIEDFIMLDFDLILSQ